VLSRLNNLEQQINDMLIFVKGDVKLTESVRASDVAADLMLAMEVALASNESSCRLELNCRDTKLLCNRQVIVSALMNLVNNALQAGGKGAGITLRVDLQNDETLSFVIEDDGPGMDAQTMEKIEGVFFTTKAQGTGLGLAVARAVARAHHGELCIDSAPGCGTRAGMRLPVHEQQGLSVQKLQHLS